MIILTILVDAVGTTRYGYDAVGQLLSEDGPWDNDTVSFTYQNRLRFSLSLLEPAASPWTQTYAYDPAKRLTNITSPAGSFRYAYVSQRSTLISQLSLPNGSFITNTYDTNARLLSTILKNSTNGIIDSEVYGYNVGNERTAETNTAGDYRNYSYDPIGQLRTAFGKEAGGTTNRWQEQLSYVYDAAGNLNYRTNNGLVQTFAVNSLNQLSTLNSSGRLTVAGTTTSSATNVTVNTSNTFEYADSTFASTNHPWSNGNNTYTAIAKDNYLRLDTNSDTVNLLTNSAFVYDLNGNLVTNGTRTFDYNDENELIRITESNAWKAEFTYDGKLRRRIETNYIYQAGTWVPTNVVRYIYDGNVPIQHRDGNNQPMLTLTRGRDLSGWLQGAGGIGGLLAMTESASALSFPLSGLSHSYFHSDGNGNVTCLINTNQQIVARYLYDSFGNTLSVSGPKAYANLYRFSSKLIHEASSMYDYLYRWYLPGLQRWINADPLVDFGFSLVKNRYGMFLTDDTAAGLNVYCFSKNRPTSTVDPLGLEPKVPDFPQLTPNCGQDNDVRLAYKKLANCESESGDGAIEAATVCECIAQGSDVAVNRSIDKFMDIFKKCKKPPQPPQPSCPTNPPPKK